MMGCSTCRYAAPGAAGNKWFGECRREPPIAARGQGPHNPIVRYFPPVQADDWCGKHQPGRAGGGQ